MSDPGLATPPRLTTGLRLAYQPTRPNTTIRGFPLVVLRRYGRPLCRCEGVMVGLASVTTPWLPPEVRSDLDTQLDPTACRYPARHRLDAGRLAGFRGAGWDVRQPSKPARAGRPRPCCPAASSPRPRRRVRRCRAVLSTRPVGRLLDRTGAGLPLRRLHPAARAGARPGDHARERGGRLPWCDLCVHGFRGPTDDRRLAGHRRTRGRRARSQDGVQPPQQVGRGRPAGGRPATLRLRAA
jgi:hypothetical protein